MANVSMTLPNETYMHHKYSRCIRHLPLLRRRERHRVEIHRHDERKCVVYVEQEMAIAGNRELIVFRRGS